MIVYSSPIVDKVAEYVQHEMDGVCTSHDFFHIERVVSMAQKLHTLEGVGDILIIEIAALMHESLDHKFFDAGTMQDRKDMIRGFLIGLGITTQIVEDIIYIIDNVGYGKSLERRSDFILSDEFKIVEDADRLEGIGAIAIARTFAYGGSLGRELHNPELKPLVLLNDKMYTSAKSSTINHFYEKLLLLKDTMHTDSGHRIAIQRHEFMETYLEQFYRERNGEIDL